MKSLFTSFLILFCFILSPRLYSQTSSEQQLYEYKKTHQYNQQGYYNTWVRELKKLANNDNPYAQQALGELYIDGHSEAGIKRNSEEAYKWFKKSADNNNPDGQFAMGWLHERGSFVKQSATTAIKWYKQASLQGSKKANLQLANLYMSGDLIEKNVDEAYRYVDKYLIDYPEEARQDQPYYRLAGHFKTYRNDKESAVSLYLFYINNYVFADTENEFNLLKTVEPLLSNAVNPEDANDLFAFATFYQGFFDDYYHLRSNELSKKIMDFSYPLAVNYFKEAAELGHVEAMKQGLKIAELQKLNTNNILTFNTLLAEAGNPDGMQYLATNYLNINDLERSEFWFQKYADVVDSDVSIRYIGDDYYEEEEYDLAKKWYLTSLQKGGLVYAPLLLATTAKQFAGTDNWKPVKGNSGRQGKSNYVPESLVQFDLDYNGDHFAYALVDIKTENKKTYSGKTPLLINCSEKTFHYNYENMESDDMTLSDLFEILSSPIKPKSDSEVALIVEALCN